VNTEDIKNNIMVLEKIYRRNRRYILSPRSKIKSDVVCNKCHIPISHYMVTDEVWREAVPNYDKLIKNKKHYNLCLWCLEKKLKVKIRISDFTDAPINFEIIFIMLRTLECI